MAKSKLLKIEDREGRQIAIYESGLERDVESGRIVKPAPASLIRAENATDYHRKRQEKTARLVRAGLVRANNAVMPRQVKTSPAAYAAALEMLWEEVALNSDSYARDRLEVVKEVGKITNLVPDQRQPDDSASRLAGMNAAAAGMNAAAAAKIAQVLADVQRMQASNADKVVDVGAD